MMKIKEEGCEEGFCDDPGQGIAVDTKIVDHYNSVVKNVTITLDEEVARWARIRAAERETSLSRLVGEMLREKMVEDKVYEEAMQQYLSGAAVIMRRAGGVYPSREDLHERNSLR